MLLAIAFAVVVTAEPTKAAPELELFTTEQLNLAWNDQGSGADEDVSFWVPRVPAGYKALAHRGHSGYWTPGSAIIVKIPATGVGAPHALAYPTDFSAIWYDGGSGANLSTAFWRPVPPVGYVSLGDVVGINTYDKPALDSVVCVRANLAVEASISGKIWDDYGSRADQDDSAWSIKAPSGSVDLQGMVLQRSHSWPSGTFYCLKITAVVPAAAPTNAEIDALLSAFGPRYRFHPNEKYFPDDPAAVLNHPQAKLEWGKTVLRTITLPLPVLEFPTTLIGSFDFLVEDSNSVPVGVCKITITGANKWSATLESASPKLGRRHLQLWLITWCSMPENKMASTSRRAMVG